MLKTLTQNLILPAIVTVAGGFFVLWYDINQLRNDPVPVINTDLERPQSKDLLPLTIQEASVEALYQRRSILPWGDRRNVLTLAFAIRNGTGSVLSGCSIKYRSSGRYENGNTSQRSGRLAGRKIFSSDRKENDAVENIFFEWELRAGVSNIVLQHLYANELTLKTLFVRVDCSKEQSVWTPVAGLVHK